MIPSHQSTPRELHTGQLRDHLASHLHEEAYGMYVLLYVGVLTPVGQKSEEDVCSLALSSALVLEARSLSEPRLRLAASKPRQALCFTQQCWTYRNLCVHTSLNKNKNLVPWGFELRSACLNSKSSFLMSHLPLPLQSLMCQYVFVMVLGGNISWCFGSICCLS